MPPTNKFSSLIEKISNQFQTGLNRNSHKLSESCWENLLWVLNWFKQKFQQIFESCQENIQLVSNWFEQKFNSPSISQNSSQASNGFLMFTPNVIEKQATKSKEWLIEG